MFDDLAAATHNNEAAGWIVFAVLMAGVIAYLAYQTAGFVRIRRRVRARNDSARQQGAPTQPDLDLYGVPSDRSRLDS
jgi:hypothetical protein